MFGFSTILHDATSENALDVILTLTARRRWTNNLARMSFSKIRLQKYT